MGLFTTGVVLAGIGIIIRIVGAMNNSKNLPQQNGSNVANQKNIVKRGPWFIVNYFTFVLSLLVIIWQFIFKGSDTIFFFALYLLMASILSILILAMKEKRSRKSLVGEVMDEKK